MGTGISGFYKTVPAVVGEDVIGDEAIVGSVSLRLVPCTDDQTGRAIVEDCIARNDDVGRRMPEVNAIGSVVVYEVVKNMAAQVSMVDTMHLAARGGASGSVCPTDIMDPIAKCVVISGGVIAMKNPRTTVIAEGYGRTCNIVNVVGNKSHMRPVVIESGSADAAYIEADDIHVIPAVVPGAVIDDVADDMRSPSLLRNVSDARVLQA